MDDFRPGDLVEIATPKGRAYLLVTHDHQSYPSVVRVLRGLHAGRPDDPAGLASGDPAFTAMIPLAGALARLGLDHRVVARIDPATLGDFPVFRMPIRDKAGAIVYWWYWDGRSLSFDADPARDDEAIPMREILSADAFLDRLLSMA